MWYKKAKNSYKYVLVTLNYGECRYFLVDNIALCSHFKLYSDCVRHYPLLKRSFGDYPETIFK